MGIVISPDSELGKELCKHEQHRTRYVGEDQQPGNPYVYRPYPAMVYMAHKRPDGVVLCMDVPPDAYLFADDKVYARACLSVETFNKRCSKIVTSEDEHRRAKNEGWRDSPTDALERHEAMEQEIARASAEALHAAQRMTPKAKEELADAGQQTHEHVVDVVPQRKRGRPAKGTIAVTG